MNDFQYCKQSDAPMPPIVCLTGSTRFFKEYQEASLAKTLDGHIVLSIGLATSSDDELFGARPIEEQDRLKAELDELHKRKIDLSDYILVLNVGGYIGPSTTSEIEYAIAHNKPITWWDHDKIPEGYQDESSKVHTFFGNSPH